MTDEHHTTDQSSIRTRQIVASFDGLDRADAVLKCRKCKFNAEGIAVDGKYVTILCPRCGVRIDGERANALFLNQAQYIQVEELRKLLAKEFGSYGYFNYEPGDESVEPSWPFYLD